MGPGGYHTIARSSKNEVYTWGHNRVGQLGFASSASARRDSNGASFLPTPTLVADIFPAGDGGGTISQVVAGWGHTGLLTESGIAYLCGRNWQGQLGLGDPDGFPKNERGHPYQPKFLPVVSLEKKRVLQMACGGEHSVFVCSDDEVYAAGTGARGQLGLGRDSERWSNCYYPVLLGSLKNSGRSVVDVATGNNCTLILAGKYNPTSLRTACSGVVFSLN